ncbi:MAG: trypsin-like peptidase domain-containing protein [Betaproteobacteria bacterium]
MSLWSALSRAEQWQLALAVAQRRGAELTRRYPNVVGVGAGYRSRREEAHPVDEICLRFMVRRKWTRAAAGRGTIPPHIRTTVNHGGRRRVVSIPTDVSVFAGGAPQATLDLTAGITTRRHGQPLDFGAACCLVRNAAHPGERYLLSCYHVFSTRLDAAPFDADCVDTATGRPLATRMEPADPQHPQRAVDAALALVDDPAVDGIAAWGRRPVARATTRDLLALRLDTPLVLTALRTAPRSSAGPAVVRPGPLRAVFQSLFPQPLPFDYRATAGRVFQFSNTVQYLADVRPGDSGSALLDDRGTLYGMHFWGRGREGFAFAATRLFDDGVFPFDIVLG